MGVLAVVGYVAMVGIFMTKGDRSSIGSYVLMAITGVILLIVFCRFYCNPSPYDYFTFSFNPEKPLAIHHYFLHILTLTLTISLIIALPPKPYIPIIPLTVQLLYTILYRPYK